MDLDRTYHIIPDDDYNHIQSENCGCNPQVANSEGQIQYIHNAIIHDESPSPKYKDEEPNYRSCKD